MRVARLQILITALVLGGISAVLAAIISVADAVLNNYGDVKLTVNGSKSYTVKGGSTLLTTWPAEDFRPIGLWREGQLRPLQGQGSFGYRSDSPDGTTVPHHQGEE